MVKYSISNIIYKRRDSLWELYLILNLFIQLNYVGKQEILQIIVNVNSANIKKSVADMKKMMINKRAGD